MSSQKPDISGESVPRTRPSFPCKLVLSWIVVIYVFITFLWGIINVYKITIAYKTAYNLYLGFSAVSVLPFVMHVSNIAGAICLIKRMAIAHWFFLASTIIFAGLIVFIYAPIASGATIFVSWAIQLSMFVFAFYLHQSHYLKPMRSNFAFNRISALLVQNIAQLRKR
jgi:hypothetical protein